MEKKKKSTVTVIIGHRGVGKTSLAEKLAESRAANIADQPAIIYRCISDQPNPHMFDKSKIIRMHKSPEEQIKQPITAIKKEIPMLFSTEMVIALKNDLKTETRRDRNLKEINENPDKFEFVCVDGEMALFMENMGGCDASYEVKCPYGQKGDLIWVRETFSPHHAYPEEAAEFIYKADIPKAAWPQYKGGWSPGIHMPKVAARIWLEIEDITIERLQDITVDSALNEGIYRVAHTAGVLHRGVKTLFQDYLHKPDTKRGEIMRLTPDPIASYKSLWEKINGKGSWEKNPWIWVIKFKKVNKQ